MNDLNNQYSGQDPNQQNRQYQPQQPVQEQYQQPVQPQYQQPQEQYPQQYQQPVTQLQQQQPLTNAQMNKLKYQKPEEAPKQNPGFPLLTTILTFLFIGIIMFVLYGIIELHQNENGLYRIISSSVNCCIILGLAASSSLIVRMANAAALIQLWFITGLYTAFQFGGLFIGINTWYGKYYMLYQIIVLFLYLCVIIPVIKISSGKK
ncbi:MAG: hypothetical protein FWG44_00360 [Oscillospiraceae bacterium]|nr:hypothetical protein [Oscillospiraceae bacterium]